MPAARPLAERFEEKVDKSGECWLWTAATSRAGYGVICVNGQMRLAHRVSYELHVGPIPDDLQLDHLCRVRHCVNPAHLEPVTNAENARRGDTGRHHGVKTHCPQGHPYDEENTKWYQGRRYCRACHRIDGRARQRRLRAAAKEIAA